jgi:hypothetical protein
MSNIRKKLYSKEHVKINKFKKKISIEYAFIGDKNKKIEHYNDIVIHINITRNDDGQSIYICPIYNNIKCGGRNDSFFNRNDISKLKYDLKNKIVILYSYYDHNRKKFCVKFNSEGWKEFLKIIKSYMVYDTLFEHKKLKKEYMEREKLINKLKRYGKSKYLNV